MKLSELILAVGDDNIMFQSLNNDAQTIEKNSKGTKFFLTRVLTNMGKKLKRQLKKKERILKHMLMNMLRNLKV